MFPAVPPQLDLGAVPLPSTFAGPLQSYRHRVPHGAAWRFLHHKRWYYVGAATPDVFVAGAIVDLGYAAKSFVYVLDRTERRLVAHASVLTPPGPWLTMRPASDGSGIAGVRTPRLHTAFSRTREGHVTFTANSADLHLRLFLSAEDAPSFVAANALVPGASNLTEKMLLMRTSGEARAGGKTYALDGTGGVDFTDGLLPRHAQWRWAFFNYGKIALNLVQGWNGASECVLATGGELEALGEATIEFDPADPEKSWHVTTRCGRVDLRFMPLAVHRETQDLKLVHSRFIQPTGIFSGRCGDHRISAALGVCEDQDTRW